MPVTAKDIAASLGISQPTVSRALSPAHQHKISPATRQRIQKVAVEMGYRPNAVARSLRRQRTNIVGFYTSHGALYSNNPFLAELIGGLQRAGDLHRLDLLLHGSYRGWATEDIYGELVDGRIDGLFIHTSPDDPLVWQLAAAALPVVALADPLPGLPSAACDDADGMKQLLGYLWDRGHRQFAFIEPQMFMPSVVRRLDALRHLLNEKSEECSLAVFTGSDGSLTPLLDSILRHGSRPTAVCCWNDGAAYALLKECRERGVNIPDDLAVTGFDGLPCTTLPSNELVTIMSPWGDVAVAAMEMLVRQINGHTVPQEVTVPVLLVAGDTA